MRGYVTWALGFTLVVLFVHTCNVLEASYMAGLATHNAEMAKELKGDVSAWSFAEVIALISLVLFVILTRLVRRDLAKAVRPCESSRDQGPPEPGSHPPQQT